MRHVREGSQKAILSRLEANTALGTEPLAVDPVWKPRCRCFFIAPKGLWPPAQGCRVARLPWGNGGWSPQPQRGCAGFGWFLGSKLAQPPCGWESFLLTLPRVAEAATLGWRS